MADEESKNGAEAAAKTPTVAKDYILPDGCGFVGCPGFKAFDMDGRLIYEEPPSPDFKLVKLPNH